MNEYPQSDSVVVPNDQQPSLETSTQKPSSTSPKWETVARERMKAAIKKFNKPLADLVARDANEGDTRLLVTDMLCEGFGFDKYSELTTEYRVKGEFADYGIRLDKDLIAFLEVKRVATKLAAKHLRQVETYAVNEGVEWVILTSGVVWQVYHITGGLPIVVDLRPGRRSLRRRIVGPKVEPALLPHEGIAETTTNRFIVAGEACDLAEVSGKSLVFRENVVTEHTPTSYHLII